MRFVELDPAFKARVEDIREEIIDLEESMVLEHIFEGKSETMLRWHLEQQAKDRGYGKAGEVSTTTNNVLVQLVTGALEIYQHVIEDKG